MPTETLPRYIEVEQTVAKVAATLPIDDPMMPNTRQLTWSSRYSAKPSMCMVGLGAFGVLNRVSPSG